MAESIKLLDGKSYLERFEKDLNKKLTDQRLRGEVSRVMEEYFLTSVEIYNQQSK